MATSVQFALPQPKSSMALRWPQTRRLLLRFRRPFPSLPAGTVLWIPCTILLSLSAANAKDTSPRSKPCGPADLPIVILFPALSALLMFRTHRCGSGSPCITKRMTRRCRFAEAFPLPVAFFRTRLSIHFLSAVRGCSSLAKSFCSSRNSHCLT